MLTDVVPVQVQWAEGYLLPPTAPGLGIEFDREAARRLPYHPRARASPCPPPPPAPSPPVGPAPAPPPPRGARPDRPGRERPPPRPPSPAPPPLPPPPPPPPSPRWGRTVIKVEQPGPGDPIRDLGDKVNSLPLLGPRRTRGAP